MAAAAGPLEVLLHANIQAADNVLAVAVAATQAGHAAGIVGAALQALQNA